MEHNAHPPVDGGHVNDRIDGYRLLSILGEGGMGIVYLAEQEQPLQRRVALKIIKAGIASPAAVARFENERQALARMRHASIAHVYDAGATESGQPFFVMEYVPGPSITAYCDQHRLANRDRLKLFRQVCLAIHHAHQKGVIHRDIKPSNVLVTEQDGMPVPKVIDFGIAKAIDQYQAGQTLFTQQGVLAGTPEYMSPEQANLDAADVDASSDVYSLGVLLYQLLVGALPFDLKELRKKGLAETLRIIREDDPLPLSHRLKTLPAAEEIARRRDTNPGTLRRLLRGDLNWIAMRAMEKDRQRRYSSAAEFAGDIERYLDHEPVIASPPGRLYRLHKFVARHRWPVTLAVAVFTALCVGLAASTVLYLRAERESQEARHQRMEAERQRAAAQQQGAEALSQRIEAQRQRDRAEQESWKANAAAGTARTREQDALWKSYVANIRAAESYIHAGELTGAQQRLLQCDSTLRGWEWRYLWSQSDTSIATLSPSLPLCSIGFSRDGRQILLATEGHVEVWNASTFMPAATYRLGPDFSKIYKMSPDGSRVVALGARSFLQLVEPASGRVVRTLQEPAPDSNTDAKPSAVAFSPGGALVAAAFSDRRIWVWNAESGDRIATIAGRAEQFSALEFSADGTRLAAGSPGGGMRAWEFRSGRILANADGGEGAVRSLAFSPDGRQLAWGAGPSLRVLDLSSGQLRVNVPVTPDVASVAFSPDSKRLLVSRTNGSTEIRDPVSGVPLEMLADGAKGNHPNGAAAFSPDGRLTLVETRRGIVRVFDAAALDVRPLPLRHGAGLGVSVERVADALRGSAIRAWQAQSGSPLKEWKAQMGFPPVRFNQDGTLLATASPGNNFTVWNAATGAPMATFSGHTAGIDELEFSQDRARIASASQDSTVRVWDIQSGRLLVIIPRPAGRIALSPDGRRVAVSPRAGLPKLEIFEVSSGRLARVSSDSPIAVSFSPNGQWIAIGDATGVLLKDPITGSVVSRLEASASGFTSGLRFTPDAGRLAVASLDGSITLWNPKEAEPLLVVPGCGTEPHAFDNFDINGELLVCAGSDGVIHTWDARLKNYPGARQLAESQLRQRFLVAEVVRQIGNDSTIGEPLRNAAVAEARRLHNDLGGLAVWVGSLIGDPSPRKEDCQLAYDRMQAVVPELPYPDNLLFSDVMGGLLYRLGRYNEALASLSRKPIDNLAGADSRATNRAAFLAMTFHQVGKPSQAREQLKALAASSPALSERLLREAEALIERSAGSVRAQGQRP